MEWLTLIALRITRPKSKLLVRLSVLGTIGLLALNFAMTALLTLASIDNYPGGEALSMFNTYYANETNGTPRHSTALLYSVFISHPSSCPHIQPGRTDRCIALPAHPRTTFLLPL